MPHDEVAKEPQALTSLAQDRNSKIKDDRRILYRMLQMLTRLRGDKLALSPLDMPGRRDT